MYREIIFVILLIALCRCESEENSLYDETDTIGDDCQVKSENGQTLGDGICIPAKSCNQVAIGSKNFCAFDDEQPIVCCQVKFKAEDSKIYYRIFEF